MTISYLFPSMFSNHVNSDHMEKVGLEYLVAHKSAYKLIATFCSTVLKDINM